MVKKHTHDEVHDDPEITNDTTDNDASSREDEELEITEEHTADTIKKLRAKLQEAEAAKRDSLEELARQKADFLNARRRLEEDKQQDRSRSLKKHIENLLPLCDSFYLAKQDAVAWDAIDEKWRRGIEGIYSQLQNLLTSYNVQSFNPTGESFDPNRHEAISSIPVTDAAAHDTIITAVQLGYERTTDDATELIRPARVMVGVHPDKE